MKTIKFFFLTIVVALLFASCEKEVIVRPGNNGDPGDPNNNGTGYSWIYSPAPATEAAPATFNGGSGSTANYTYYVRVPLNNFKINPYSGGVLSQLYVPHVGPGSTTIYNNVNNDATYTIYKVEAGYAYVSIVTNNVTATGCILEWNISVGDGSNPNWAVANGDFAKLGPTYSYDDGINNVYRIRFLDGHMYHCW